MSDSFTYTAYGFEWGPVEVTRLLTHRGGVMLAVAGKRGRVDIWVTPTGQLRVLANGIVRDRRNRRLP